MELIFEYTGQTVDYSKPLIFSGILTIAVSVWLGLKMPWPSYGKIIPLWGLEDDAPVAALSVAIFVALIGAGFALIGLYWGQHPSQTANAPPLKQEIVEGYVSEMKYYSTTPRSVKGAVTWCIDTFWIRGTQFDLSKGRNYPSFCARSILPADIKNDDYVRVTYQGDGWIYKIEKRAY